MIKLSKTLSEMLNPLVHAMGTLPVSLLFALKRTGKRGNKSHYPTDLRRINLILETTHDVTGRLFSVQVYNGDVQDAIERLQRFWNNEDIYCEHLAILNS